MLSSFLSCCPSVDEESSGVRDGDTEVGERESERERGGGKEEERQTETHIICPRSKGSHSDIIYRVREGVEV